MSENYQFVRPSIIASLLKAESQAGQAVFPHKIFEVGKVAFLDSAENTGTKTIQSLGFMTASNNANYNDLASEVSTLLYLLDHKYDVKEIYDPRFISGRQAAIMLDGKQVGVFGEVHPQVLENWGITVPCVAGEIDIEALMPLKNQHQNTHVKAEAKSVKTVGNISLAETDPVAYFNSHIELLVAKIEKVETNLQGDRLYIETLDDGSGIPRTIQSGLRPYLKEEELLGKHVIIAANLAPRKMKGVESRGMLLAADYTENGKEKIELLTASWAKPGTKVVLEGTKPGEKPAKIDIDKFAKISYQIKDYSFLVAGKKALADGKEIKTKKANNCDVQ